MSSTNSTCSILAYFVPYVNKKLNDSCKFFEECDTLRDNWKTEMEYLERVCIPEVANQIWILWCRSPQKLIYKRYLEWISPHTLFRGFLNIFKTIFIRTVSGASIELLMMKTLSWQKHKNLFLIYLLFANADLRATHCRSST